MTTQEKPYTYCISTFKAKNSFQERKSQCATVRAKYINKIPIIVEKMKNTKAETPDISKHNFLAPDDANVSQFLHVIKKYMALESTESVYLFINDELISTGESLSNLYVKYKDADGFLYMYYARENTFG